MEAVASYNKTERGGSLRIITADQALARLEVLFNTGRLKEEHRDRLRRLVNRIAKSKSS